VPVLEPSKTIFGQFSPIKNKFGPDSAFSLQYKDLGSDLEHFPKEHKKS
jgi:hypothetical protein